MDFMTLAKERYSVRDYKDTPIEEEKLQKILEAGRIAPTAKNNQEMCIRDSLNSDRIGKRYITVQIIITTFQTLSTILVCQFCPAGKV